MSQKPSKPYEDLTEFQIIWCFAITLVSIVGTWAYLSR